MLTLSELATKELILLGFLCLTSLTPVADLVCLVVLCNIIKKTLENRQSWNFFKKNKKSEKNKKIKNIKITSVL